MRYAILILSLISCIVATYASPAGNIEIESLTNTYTVQVKDGVPVAVKNVERAVYRALLHEENAKAYTFYDGSTTIDKATAPGAESEYRQHFDKNIFYDDTRVCILSFKVKPGKEAVAEFRRTITSPEKFDYVTIASHYPVKQYTLEIVLPADVASRYAVSNFRFPEDAVVSDTFDALGTRTIRAQLFNLPAYEREKGADAAILVAPAVLVTGYFDGMPGLYRYLRGYLADEPVDDAVASTAAAATASCADDIERANAIASWVRRNIRYVAIEHGEWAFRPDAGADVLTKRYGDCKGSANLIKAMLKSQGIDGRMVWIGTKGDVPLGWDEAPALCCGNHCIAAAVVADSIIYLDGTVPDCPDGFLPWSIQGQSAIVEDGNSFISATVPRTAPDSSADELRVEMRMAPDFKGVKSELKTFVFPNPPVRDNMLKLSSTAVINPDEGTVTIDRTVDATGSAKAAYSGFTSIKEWVALVENYLEIKKMPEIFIYSPERLKQLEELVADEIEQVLGNRAASVDSWAVTGHGVLPGDNELELKSRSVHEGLLADAGNDLLFSVGKLFSNAATHQGDFRSRKVDAWRTAGDTQRYTLDIDIPDGYTVTEEALASLVGNMRTPVGQFVTTAQLSDDGRRVTVSMLKSIKYPRIPATLWDEYLKITDSAAAFNEAVLVLTRK